MPSDDVSVRAPTESLNSAEAATDVPLSKHALLGDLPSVQKTRAAPQSKLKRNSTKRGVIVSHTAVPVTRFETSPPHQSVTSLRDAIAAQERLVATLQEQKIQRDAQMNALKDAFRRMAAASFPHAHADDENNTNEMVAPEDTETTLLRSGGRAGDIEAMVGAVLPMPSLAASSSPDEASAVTATAAALSSDVGALASPLITHTASVMEHLLGAIGTFVTAREMDRVAREQMGFTGTAPLGGEAFSEKPHSHSTLEEDLQLLKEEEEALLEMLAFEKARVAQKVRKSKKVKRAHKHNVSSATSHHQDPCAEEDNFYEDDFEDCEDDEGVDVDQTRDAVIDAERRKVFDKLLEEYQQEQEREAVEGKGICTRKVVGLGWLEDDENIEACTEQVVPVSSMSEITDAATRSRPALGRRGVPDAFVEK